jgi:hypothetical protein
MYVEIVSPTFSSNRFENPVIASSEKSPTSMGFNSPIIRSERLIVMQKLGTGIQTNDLILSVYAK